MSTPPQRTWRDYLGITLRGFVMGTADVIPGVSGGTMAFILGIYEELIDAIRAVVPFLRNLLAGRWKDGFTEFPWRFLLALLIGIGTAILSLARLLHQALETHPQLVYAFFFGLIVASVYVVRRRVRRWTVGLLATVLLFAVGAFFLTGLRPAQTPETPWFIFLSGALGICAMILPGISGAFVLVLLGKYQYILQALIRMDLPTLLIFMAGAAIGIVTFASFLRWLLHHYHDATVAALVGFMLGALREVWPWKQERLPVLPTAWSGEEWMAVVLMLIGFVAVIALETIAERRERRAPAKL
ncbi:MAG: DUF368 domain-containing protein [Anaerolineales bacterium]|nr:DUF368 domain-containing protein [Anaerolineales bacterium]MCX7609543.1 DUF368 domain-containing protein [Anaerolineales bacterium]MDW8226211.1 DUF368 domain-containing protein [Anaerolineales bacterium]